MLGSELRQKYLDFFIGKGAQQLPSDSLVTNDPTLLFTVAGMVPLVPYFLGEATPPSVAVTTCQKCLRTVDIDDIGDTSHCTFFEMLGNFSFGGYFKAEAVAWAWEFLFDVLKLDLERVRVTIFETDDEAYELWRAVGMPDRKIFRFGEADNYWPASVISEGPNTACGPCSEIFFDTQPDLPPTPDGVWDDSRWLEIWNLVFTQFERKDGGILVPLPKKNIDTGMGLDRTLAALNDLRGPFETDLFAPILARLQELSGKTYGSTDDAPLDIAFRRVADHVRATTFLIADGVLPKNEGRGYILRRLMRRAILAGRNTLGFEKPFLAEVIPAVIAEYRGVYPEIGQKESAILTWADKEEQQFRRTLNEGSQRLTNLLESKVSGETLSGDDAFVLFTTYGFPVEMTKELAAERGVGLDRARYDARMEEHAVISNANKERGVMLKNVVVQSLREANIPNSVFTGHSETITNTRILAIINGDELVPEAFEDETVQVVLDMTPFYAESGGQVGDTGALSAAGGQATVEDTQKESGYWFHRVTVTAGSLRVGDAVEARIDEARRQSIRRNHSVTHLLHHALQDVLGDHVQQRGSLVAPERLRFDFSHDKSLTDEETRQVEAIVNEQILDDYAITTMEKPIEEAKQMGAMMLFGEKYGTTVRVVQMGPSLEFCGGTHLAHTSQAGLFKIVSESSSQAGVRRIEGVTGQRALLKTLDQERILQDAAAVLRTSPMQLVASVERLQADLRAKEKELAALHKAASGGQVEQLVSEAQQIGGARLVVASIDGADGDALRTLADEILDRLKSGAVILGGRDGEKLAFAAKVSKDFAGRALHAGNLVKAAAAVAGGGGGGRPDFAQAGGKDPSKLADAMATAEKMAREALA